MKRPIHAIAGVLGFLVAASLFTSTVVVNLVGSAAAVATVMWLHFVTIFFQLPTLAGAGATGMSLLGTRTDSLGLEKQKRGPRAFMTTLLVLLPTTGVLWWRSSAGQFDTLFYVLQGVELAALTFCMVQIGLNIRDGLALSGRIAPAGATGPVIVERNGGPLVVNQVPALTGPDGKNLKNGAVMALCRCGQSKNKPFCDGTHFEIGFDSTPSDDRSKDGILTYEGKEVTVHYNRLLCSHAAECGRRQAAAFDSKRTPWIVPDNAPADGMAEVVKACPSGALRLSRPGGEPAFARSEVDGILIEKNGPYRVTGVPLADARLAKGANPEKYVLCRCGASKNKPYCDGSHVDIGWKG